MERVCISSCTHHSALTWILKESLQRFDINAALFCQLVLPVGNSPVHQAANAFHSPDANNLLQGVIRPAEAPFA